MRALNFRFVRTWFARYWLAGPGLTSTGAALMAIPIPGFAVVAAAIAIAVEHRRASTAGLVADRKPRPLGDTGTPGILGRP